MTTSIRLPEEVQAAMKELARTHTRTLHGEIVQACKAWIQAERKSEMTKQETDTIYSRGELYPWIVVRDPRTRAGEEFQVLADSADHACQYITATKYVSRLSLTARPASKEDGEK